MKGYRAHRETKLKSLLGMPMTTARMRLRKNIIFHLLVKHSENVCHVCENVIHNVDELSVEHKIPWESVSSDLFWSMDNVAFSHVVCNKPHSYPGPPKIERPDGQDWCSGCKSFKDITEFSLHRSRWTGRNSKCKKCVSIEQDNRKCSKS